MLQRLFHTDVGILPLREPVRVVFGRPIHTRSEAPLPQPTGEALVDEVHARYVAALRALYDDHKNVFALSRVKSLKIH